MQVTTPMAHPSLSGQQGSPLLSRWFESQTEEKAPFLQGSKVRRRGARESFQIGVVLLKHVLTVQTMLLHVFQGQAVAQNKE